MRNDYLIYQYRKDIALSISIIIINFIKGKTWCQKIERSLTSIWSIRAVNQSIHGIVYLIIIS